MDSDGLDQDSDGTCDNGDQWPNCSDVGSNPYDDCNVCNGGNADLDECGVCFPEVWNQSCTGCTDQVALIIVVYQIKCLKNLVEDVEKISQ